MKKLKQQLSALMLIVVILTAAACQSLGLDWPEEGVIVEQAFDVPRVGRYWVIGTVKEVEINYDYIYWFKIESKDGNRVWVQVDPQTWKAYEVGQHWVKIPEARVRYQQVNDTDAGPNPQRTLRSPQQLPQPK